jgi:formylglycine-generating enzyme required for sulfatase activity
VHRDLKPENIMIREKDKKVYLTDFGLASQVRTTLSRKPGFAIDISGTLPYMSPEQYLGRKVDGRTDNWALGVIVYEMVEGNHPFQATTLEHYMKIVCEVEPETPERLSEREWEIVQSLLKKERKERAENAQEVLINLQKGKAIEIQTNRSQERERQISITKTAKEGYGLEKEIWKNCQYKHKETRILDMASTHWEKLSVKQQIEYAREYQEGYAKEIGVEIEKKIQKNGALWEFSLIPPGRFWMGSPEKEKDRESRETRHRVVISKPYYIGKYEVTQGQWKVVMGNNPAYFQNAGEKAPVEQVSWDDCQEFCKKVGMELSTEAQWEYACRSGVSAMTYQGDFEILGDNNGGSILDRVAWYGGNSGVQYEGGWDSSGWDGKQYNHTRAGTHAVGGKDANAWGMYDMLGNVWEWCRDCYGGYGVEDVHDPVGAAGGSFRVCRGGGWSSNARDCRAANRSLNSPGHRSLYLGFRLQVTL